MKPTSLPLAVAILWLNVVGAQTDSNTTGTPELVIVAEDGNPPDAFPLSKCEGDCNQDTDCADGLICFQRDAGNALSIPGCLGETDPAFSFDYCFDPLDIPVGELVIVGNNSIPAALFPLQKCQGDCDVDTDCADGLVCFQRGDQPTVPGCTGTADIPEVDYCADPNDEPVDTPPPTLASDTPAPTGAIASDTPAPTAIASDTPAPSAEGTSEQTSPTDEGETPPPKGTKHPKRTKLPKGTKPPKDGKGKGDDDVGKGKGENGKGKGTEGGKGKSTEGGKGTDGKGKGTDGGKGSNGKGKGIAGGKGSDGGKAGSTGKGDSESGKGKGESEGKGKTNGEGKGKTSGEGKGEKVGGKGGEEKDGKGSNLRHA